MVIRNGGITEVAAPPNWRKPLVGMLVGALAGGAGMALFIAVADPLSNDQIDSARLILGAVGVVYLMTGLFVALGAASPKLGSKFLNVADADDIRQQRAILGWSALSTAAVGALLLTLAFARGRDGVGVLDPLAVMIATGVLLVGSFILTTRLWLRYDELMRQLSIEGGAIAFTLLLPALTLWAAADHLGYPVSLDPLGVIAALYGLMLAGTIIAVARRGLMTPPPA